MLALLGCLTGCTVDEARDNPDDAHAPNFRVETRIQAGAGGKIVAALQVAFSFTCDYREGCDFECSLDGKTFEPCRSPFVARELSLGRHSFAVRAHVADVFDRTPDQRTFEIFPMKSLAGGCFRMGSFSGSYAETPVVKVCLRAYAIDPYEVTVGAYQSCVAAGVCTPPEDYSAYSDPQRLDWPILGVSWEDADQFCRWAEKRLPTEAEWEHAARGGLVDQPYPNGATMDCSKAVFAVCEGDEPKPVGSFAPNGYGFYDMAGNAYEWVNDWYYDQYYRELPWGVTDPTGPSRPTGLRSMRGGAYDSHAASLTVFSRFYGIPTNRFNYSGFRCAR